MIMVLSYFDLLAAFINHPFIAYVVMFCLIKGKANSLKVSWVYVALFVLSYAVTLSSFLALLVMNCDRYLATYHPIYHRTSVTKRRLLTLFAILIVVKLILLLTVDIVISFYVALLVFFIIFYPPMLFMNYKLLTIANKGRRNREISPDTKNKFSLKNISSCLLAVACFVALSISLFVYIALRINSICRRWKSWRYIHACILQPKHLIHLRRYYLCTCLKFVVKPCFHYII